MERKKPQPYKRRQKDLILRALTEPAFRKLLAVNPAKALGKKMTVERKKEVDLILAVVKGIEAQISHLADELLCANGPCGIA
jgi:hypothetical protein